MGLDTKELARLGEDARRQIMAELTRTPREEKKPPLVPGSMFESELEREYYERYIFPLLATGKISKVEMHRKFELLPQDEYCGIKLPAVHYTPDFLVSYKDGTVDVVEVKHAKIRKLQRDYIYRRRLFIEKIARPSGWRFKEYIRE